VWILPLRALLKFASVRLPTATRHSATTRRAATNRCSGGATRNRAFVGSDGLAPAAALRTGVTTTTTSEENTHGGLPRNLFD
jgi:hypothetical protein